MATISLDAGGDGRIIATCSQPVGAIEMRHPYNLGPSTYALVRNQTWGLRQELLAERHSVQATDAFLRSEQLLHYGTTLRRITEAIRVKTTPAAPVARPGFNGSLKEFQERAVRFLHYRGGRAVIALHPGLGKTRLSLAYLHDVGGRVLVVGPVVAKGVWTEQVKENMGLDVFNITGETPIPVEELVKHRFVAVNFDVLDAHLSNLQMARFDHMVVDEAHFIKDVTASRSKQVLQLARAISGARIALSGTPLNGYGNEAWTLLKLVSRPEVGEYLPDWREFSERHGKPDTIRRQVIRAGVKTWENTRVYKGVSNHAELSQRLESVMFRLTKKEAMPDLPPKTHIRLPIKMDAAVSGRHAKIVENYVQYLRDAGETERAEKAEKAEALTAVNALREMLAIAKIPTILELVRKCNSIGQQVLVFSNFKQPLVEMREALGDEALTIAGGVTAKKRTAAAQAFQAGEVRNLLCNYTAAGTALTLTAAHVVIFADMTWSPAVQLQAEDRAHRINTTHEVFVYTAVAEGTVEERMERVLIQKMADIEAAVDRRLAEDDAEESFQQETLEVFAAMRNRSSLVAWGA